MEVGQVRSVYLTLNYHRVGDEGVVAHEIQISKDGKPLLKSTPAKPDQPDKLLFDKTQMPAVTRFSCERIGSKLYIVSGEGRLPENAIGNLAYVLDAKSSGELVKLHELPSINSENPNIIAAHGRLYHLARPVNNTLGRPMPFEVYDPSTKSWDPLPPLPQAPFFPYAKAPRLYFGYAVWGSCILFALGFLGMSLTTIFFVPVLFNAESRTWHQVYVKHNMGGVNGCFPWHDKAVAVGDTIYALGFKRGTIISFSITKSGSEEDGTLSYSLTTPYFLNGLKIISHPKYKPCKCSEQCWSPLGDFEFCLVQTICSTDPRCQPFFITTFRIIHKEGTFSRIQSLYSAIQFMSTQGYGKFLLLFCYNPDYEPKEALLNLTKDMLKERNKIEGILQEVDNDILGIKPIEASLTHDEKVEMQNETNSVKCSPCNVEHLKLDSALGGESATTVEIKSSSGNIDSNSGDFEPEESMIDMKKMRRRLKRKVKRSEKKGTKRDSYIVSLVKHQVSTIKSFGGRAYVPIACIIIILFIGLLFGLFSLPENYK